MRSVPKSGSARDELLAGLQASASALRRVAMSGSAPCRVPRGATEQVDLHARLILPLAGEERRTISSAGLAETVLLRPGEGFAFAPQAWTAVHHDRPCRFLAVVFRRAFVRLVLVERRRQGRPTVLLEHHTARPAQGALLHAVRALSSLCESGDDHGAAVAMATVLLRLTRTHLARDPLQAAGHAGGASATWGRIVEHLHERFADDVSRDAVARAFSLHPSYVSALARAHGEGFAATLAGIRCARAEHLLRRTALPLREIARRCGYADPGYLIRIFRRREGITPGELRRRAAGRAPGAARIPVSQAPAAGIPPR